MFDWVFNTSLKYGVLKPESKLIETNKFAWYMLCTSFKNAIMCKYVDGQASSLTERIAGSLFKNFSKNYPREIKGTWPRGENNSTLASTLFAQNASSLSS